MKRFYQLITCFLVLTLMGCTEDDRGTNFVDEVAAPANISITFDITQDNSGLVAMTPGGEGATGFRVAFGDGSGNPVDLNPGESTEHTYAEGTYNVKVIATGINGLTTEFIQPLTVSFQAPENLMVTISPVIGDVFSVDVSATADLEAYFEFYPGESMEETPIQFMEGETITYTYAAVGDYEARVVALSGGAATTEYTETISIVNPLLLPIDFEDPTLNFSFVDFGNVSSSVVPNPDMSGENTSATVGQSVKPAGAEVWAGTFLQLDDPIDFSTLNNIKVNVWSPASGITVKLKLENATDDTIATEVDVTNTVSNAWETLVFDFSTSDLSQDYQKVVLFFDFGNPGNDSTYYFDDIDLTQSIADVFELFENFEGATPPSFIDFGNIGATQVVANPAPDGNNGTASVAQFTKANGAEVWGGTFFELNNQAIEFAATKKMRFKSWSPTAGTVVKLKIENADASVTHEVDVNTSVANAWETLTYDFIDAPVATYVRVVVFYNFGTPGDGTVYYFDEMEVGEDALVSTIPPLPVEDFEGAPPAFISFGNIADTQVIANPNSSGLNTTANVAELFKTAGSEVWAGTFFEVGAPLDLNNYSNIRVLTHSPTAGIVVKLKLENADASITHEVDIVNSFANNWEELVYDFSEAPAADYVRIVIFFDFGTPGNDSSYYFDEIQLTN
ncbi:MAG: hypothetical protein KJO41_07955 [Bacteroidia bacterium]|nr:hypothetical protein [Bacteroidia bacterium]NND25614.1 hypothetical protein [Flavobacteriaceae bacterium]MBT8278920.1 hypothetical protein [Bacteroidia bacterium]NNK59850.1 hypothetical protein [Flavobacteriaceae bacterium]NNL32305.1 hypothetical protein [Flavobacteriaceae bacterium]